MLLHQTHENSGQPWSRVRVMLVPCRTFCKRGPGSLAYWCLQSVLALIASSSLADRLPCRPASGDGDRLDASGIVVRWLVDEGAHGLDGHRVRPVGAEQHRLVRKRRLELIRRQDHGHAVVNGRHDPVGCGREARADLDHLSLLQFCKRSRVCVSSRTVQCSQSPVKADNHGYFSALRLGQSLKPSAGISHGRARQAARKEGLALAVWALALISL